MEYNVRIGSGKILEGSVTGEIHFHFNKNGLVVEIPDTEQYFNKKNINGISFKTQLKDKVKKGSSLAKTAAFMAAANKKNKNIGQQIAMSQRFADMGRDSVVQEEIKICIINIKSIGDLVIDFGSSSDIQKKLVKAYNNPKSFFVQSIKDQKFQAKVNKVSSKVFGIIGICFLWVYGAVSPIMWVGVVFNASNTTGSGIIFTLIGNIILAYLIYRKTKWGKKSKPAKEKITKNDKVLNFENSKEYEEILKNLS